MGNRSTYTSYVRTFPLVDGKIHPDYQAQYDTILAHVRQANAERRRIHNERSDLLRRPKLFLLYAQKRARLGKNNPNAQKYKDCPRLYQTIHMKDGVHCDVYLYEREVK